VKILFSKFRVGSPTKFGEALNERAKKPHPIGVQRLRGALLNSVDGLPSSFSSHTMGFAGHLIRIIPFYIKTESHLLWSRSWGDTFPVSNYIRKFSSLVGFSLFSTPLPPFFEFFFPEVPPLPRPKMRRF